MTVGYYAPMPPARSGVADYAADLLAALRQSGSVEIAPASADINLYHLGNNQLYHAEIYSQALREPGVIVLHDAVLHHFLLSRLSPEEYIAEFTYNYGEWSRELAIGLWNNRARSGGDIRYFQHPMLRRICEVSRAVIVHNPAAARMVREHAPGARVFEIPLLHSPQPAPSPADVHRTREALRLKSPGPLCGVFGYLRESKRLSTIIRACEDAGVNLLIAGSGSADLEKSLAPWLHRPFVVRRGYTDPHEFETLAHAVDVCVNLKYPSAGETSAVSIRLMGAGKPVLMSEGEENSRYPGDCCIRIDPGIAERSHLTAILKWFQEFPRYARETGARAAAYIKQAHDPAMVARMYWDVLRGA